MCYRLFSESRALGTHSQSIARTPMWIPQIVLVAGMLATDVRLLLDTLRLVSHRRDTADPVGKESG
jgi:hypothetical protein